ncbi:tetratricopeptide repeat protein [Anabaena sp. CCY 9402-a]|uniref:tetratricopeptide repeat protein n=1 Tax=Anabaena sp. CCY 9402-a TaxID=3103867 RepID=UPI0039C74F02
MNRFILSFSIAVTFAGFVFAAPAHSLSTVKKPNTASIFLQSGIEKLLHGNYQEAIENFNAAIELRKDSAPAYSDRCLAYLQLADYQNAIADCNQALKLNPDNVEAHLNRGIAYHRLEEYGEAIADNNQVIALKPHDFRAYYNRGIAHAMLGNYQQAISDYNLALITIPQTSTLRLADIYNDRGLAWFELSNLPSAMGNFSKAIHLNPHDYRAYYNRGCACGRSGDDSCAIRDFTASLQLQPHNAQAYLNRGIANHQLGHEQAAIADLQKAVEYFAQEGATTNYEKTLNLLKNLQQQLSSQLEIALI